MRFTSNPPAHRCEFEPIQARDITQFPISKLANLPIEQWAQTEIASLLAFVDAPLHVVEDGYFHRLLNALVDIGCEDCHFQLGGERSPLTRYRTRRAMVDESIHQRDRAIE
jgi:hypothetical protein